MLRPPGSSRATFTAIFTKSMSTTRAANINRNRTAFRDRWVLVLSKRKIGCDWLWETLSSFGHRIPYEPDTWPFASPPAQTVSR